MSAPKIGYENFFTTGTVTATSEASGFEKENAYDWLLWDWWKASAAGTVYYTVDYGSARAADYWAIASHDLSDNSGTVQCQYSSDNFAADTNDIGDLITPSDNSPIFHEFSSVSARYWRLKIVSSGSASKIGVASIGAAFQLSRAYGSGQEIPYDADNFEGVNLVSEDGTFLGRSIISESINSNITLTLQTLAVARGDWRNFITHAKSKPFFYSWNPTYSTDVVYCWMNGNPTAPAYTSHILMSFGISIMGVKS